MNQEILLKEIMRESIMDIDFPGKLFQEALEYRIGESKEITERLYSDIVNDMPYSFVSGEKPEEKMRLVVDVSDDFLNDYRSGAIKLANEKGHLVAQIKENNKYGSKLPIKEENYQDASNSLNLENAIQLQAIQESLVVISQQIQIIDNNVKEVLKGQQNDRLGFYYSGVSIFIEACSIKDDHLRKYLMAQSLKTLSDAIFQLILTLQDDIRYIENKEFNKDKKHKFDLLNAKMTSIDRAFIAIHQASIMKAAIYCYQGEVEAMTSTLREYERFITGTIVKNADMLSLCDSNKDRILQEEWKKRANFQLDLENVIEKLQSNEQYIFLKGRKNNESF